VGTGPYNIVYIGIGKVYGILGLDTQPYNIKNETNDFAAENIDMMSPVIRTANQ
jgi:hypothetical protein